MSEHKPPSKVVSGNQKAVDALPLNTGTWRVEGVPGLYVRCRATSKSFFLQRRKAGRLIKETLGALTVKLAKEKAMATWSAMKPKPAAGDAVTLEQATEQFIEDRLLSGKLAASTEKNYRYNLGRYLSEWRARSLRDIGSDRAGMRLLQRQITQEYGAATANQVVQLISAVYRWQRGIDPDLPEPPTTAVKIHSIRPRDSAYSPDQLKAWWFLREEKDGKIEEMGVSTLGPIKKMWWLAALLTGARRGSIEALRWSDIDMDKRVIRFRVAKGGRAYSIPASDTLIELLGRYRDSGDVPPSEWAFPSSVIEGAHIVGVKDNRCGVLGPHRLRHTFRTTLAELGAGTDQAKILMGHSLTGVSGGYITSSLVVESLRPITNAVAAHYVRILGLAIK
jgi:integrase